MQRSGSTLSRALQRSAVLLLGLIPTATGQAPAADMILVGGHLVTLDDSVPEAEALAVSEGRIVALGSDQEIQRWRGPDTELIELSGESVLPGFIEGHGHFLGIGQTLTELDLTRAASWGELVSQVEAAVADAAPDQLIRGRGWHQEKWKSRPERLVEGLPTHHELSADSAKNPVILVHASGHASFANARALELAGIDRDTPDPPGGQIVRDAEGEPIGVLRETAAGLLDGIGARAGGATLAELARLADREVLSKGITSFQDAGSSFETIESLAALAEAGELGVRLWVMVRDSPAKLAGQLARARRIGAANHHFTVRAIKFGVDGALGSHGAWLLEPYADAPEALGLNTTPLEVLEKSAALALEHGYQLCVHAIGDRANREMLDLYERSFAGRDDAGDLRWRIEHAQHLHPDDIPRFAGLGVIASMQAIHCTSDGPWVPERIGEERARSGAYMWRSLLDSGAIVTNGTDAPVEDVDPIATFNAAVSRRMPDGRVFHGEQCMTRMEALRAATISNAHAAFEEHEKGSLSIGKLADLVVLDQNILEVPEDEIPRTRVVMTIVGGEVLYRRP
jgi:predicted amidohydrolase YtcJ